MIPRGSRGSNIVDFNKTNRYQLFRRRVHSFSGTVTHGIKFTYNICFEGKKAYIDKWIYTFNNQKSGLIFWPSGPKNRHLTGPKGHPNLLGGLLPP